MTPDHFSPLDRYRKREGRIAITGIQALIRIPIDQNRRDREAGLRIGTYVSGYQGSPLGAIDKQMRMAAPLLGEHDIRFEMGINEDLAATAIYGTQFLDRFPHSKYDGVLGIWYGKSPGLDRSGDIMRHAQYLGTSRHGASLVVTGDDPAIKSSSIPSDSTIALFDWFFPVFYPGNTAEVLEYGLHAVALSRYSGTWTALKIVTNVAEGGAIIEVSPRQAAAVLPELEIDGKPFRKKQDTRVIPPYNLEVEQIIHYERLEAVKAYARANALNRIAVRGENDRFGLVSMGKTYYDLLLALEILGLTEEKLKEAGIRIYKLGMISPIEPEGLRDFADGLEEILVVEEKRGFVEMLICHQLFNLPSHPRVFGKSGPDGRELFPKNHELQPEQIAKRLAGYFEKRLGRKDLTERVRRLTNIDQRAYGVTTLRMPYFCSGCPHNTSTRLPEGEMAGGGIGCHGLAYFMGRGICWFPQMGGEGAPWIGLRHYTDREHMFQNVGDGTYFHSGSKAVEACVARNANITFKILYNATVAMTGGQEVVGRMDPIAIARKLELEGVKEIVIVPEDIGKYPKKRIGDRISIRPRDDYNQVMLELKKVKGVTAIIFDQLCAAEKRRLRKQGKLETPEARIYIHEGICEGCGDCGIESNCLSVIPIETEYGRKTALHQSSCNFDYSCLKGDCPAFITVRGGKDVLHPMQRGLSDPTEAPLPEPENRARCEEPYKILIVGVGGTGVVTMDALLVEAAFVEGLHAVHLDQTGLSQKAGSVMSNIIIAKSPMTRPNKISAGEADLLLALDLLSSVSPDNLHRLHPDNTVAVVNTHSSHTGEEISDVKAQRPPETSLLAELEEFTRKDRTIALDVEELSEALFANTKSNNIILLGVAYQAGLIPLKAESIEGAIRANGVDVEQNLQAFRWGRRYVQHRSAVESVIRRDDREKDPRREVLAKLQFFAPRQVERFTQMVETFSAGRKLTDIIFPRVADLILYQDSALAQDFLEFVRRIAEEEACRTPGRTELGEAVARWLFKLMAYKDEYEVARLILQHPFQQRLARDRRGRLKIHYLLHPPLLRAVGLKEKLPLGKGFFPLFRILYGLRRLRGTPLDIFGYSRIRREERRLIAWYRGLIESLLPDLKHENHGLAVSIASAPDHIRGFESVKMRTIAETEAEVARLLEAFRADSMTSAAG
jgi:indolepyruvate ferredoxin oxidoreductase